MIMHYVSSKLWAAIGLVLATPSAVIAVIEGERITMFLGIATGVLAFLWAARKCPMEQRIADANKALDENHKLRETNINLAEQNERFRVRIANEEESGHYRKPENRD